MIVPHPIFKFPASHSIWLVAGVLHLKVIRGHASEEIGAVSTPSRALTEAR
jgi:hypothetical protein